MAMEWTSELERRGNYYEGWVEDIEARQLWTLQVVCNDPAPHEPVVCKEWPQPVVPPPGICMQQSHLDVQAKRQTLCGRSIGICTTPLWVGSISANTVGIEVWKELMLQVRVIQIQLVGSTQLLNRGITGNIPYDLLSSPELTFPLGRFSSASAKTNMPSNPRHSTGCRIQLKRSHSPGAWDFQVPQVVLLGNSRRGFLIGPGTFVVPPQCN